MRPRAGVARWCLADRCALIVKKTIHHKEHGDHEVGGMLFQSCMAVIGALESILQFFACFVPFVVHKVSFLDWKSGNG